jgi:hypothetical protein
MIGSRSEVGAPFERVLMLEVTDATMGGYSSAPGLDHGGRGGRAGNHDWLIAGRVADAQGLAVPGAAVTISLPQGSRTLTTDTDGRFFAPFLTPGDYEVKVNLAASAL